MLSSCFLCRRSVWLVLGWLMILGRTMLVPAAVATLVVSTSADDTAGLRLVPFPKEVQCESGRFDARQPLVLESPPDRLELWSQLVGEEFRRAGLPRPKARPLAESGHWLRLVAEGKAVAPSPGPLRDSGSEEEYVLCVAPGGIAAQGRGPAGLFYALQTVLQRVRANRNAYESLGREFSRIWLAKSKPYALDWTAGRYEAAIARYEKWAQRVAELRRQVQAGQALPPADAGGVPLD